jgi:hypothetical protein
VLLAKVALMLVLPQVAGFGASRGRRHQLIWPLVAVATFAVSWYAMVWAPTSAAAEHQLSTDHYACGEWMVAATAVLMGGLGTHLGAARVLSWLDRLAHRVYDRPPG